jgi:hypothetical protein
LKRAERVGCGIVASVFLVAGFFATFKFGTRSGAAAHHVDFDLFEL